MKWKKTLAVLLMLVLTTGVIVSPSSVNAKEYLDAETVLAKEWVAWMTENGQLSDTYIFSQKSQGKWIPIKPQAEGILKVGYGVSVYDKDKKPAKVIWGTEDKTAFLPNVKRTDTFYLKLPDKMTQNLTVNVVIKKDNVTPLETKILYTQSGQDRNVYQTFKVKKRGLQSLYVAPACYNKKDVTFFIQRKEKGKWKTISKTLRAVADDHEKTTFYYGLKAGEYRLVSKASKEQVYQMDRQGKSMSANYRTKKSKAQKIKLKTAKTNVYTPTEKASRWYRVYKKTANHKRYVKLSVKNNSGKMKFSIYKKGRTKAVKTYTLSGDKSRTYRLKNGRGTYYVKVSKSGSKMNGQYSIQYK